ncbi:hypothetical protein PDESU_03869 [Pontiella desulfatans]|uniref:Uncharacterized protein n=1 Tax=Pontiella desulfatans TaxID=2750659 RepID=A0A6C2U656_PONDE|nr:hypothetical protein [Pontiella desulfatans]VGO15287.1 hypothetical protein PDESU_03869 [Pontiella desulfatans]
MKKFTTLNEVAEAIDDRGFSVVDPNGVSLYIFSERDPSEEFKQYYKN